MHGFRGRCRRCYIRHLAHFADEPDTLARQRTDQPLRLAIVADRRLCRVDAAEKCGVRDRAAAPDGVEQLVVANDAIADADKTFQKVEYLRPDGDMILRTAQLASVGVEHEVTDLAHPS